MVEIAVYVNAKRIYGIKFARTRQWGVSKFSQGRA